jgi:D-alanine-D-alanine ligase-like ATP-grasp enzyme
MHCDQYSMFSRAYRFYFLCSVSGVGQVAAVQAGTLISVIAQHCFLQFATAYITTNHLCISCRTRMTWEVYSCIRRLSVDSKQSNSAHTSVRTGPLNIVSIDT